MRILNGRLDDQSVYLTCFSGEGASVVDYMIVTEGLFKYIKHFNVLDRDDSDHPPISCKLKRDLQRKALSSPSESIPVTGFQKFIFDTNKVEAFLNLFRELLTRRTAFIQKQIDVDVNDDVNLITRLYHEAAINMRLCARAQSYLF